jgi:hypothetical protein
MLLCLCAATLSVKHAANDACSPTGCCATSFHVIYLDAKQVTWHHASLASACVQHLIAESERPVIQGGSGGVQVDTVMYPWCIIALGGSR